MDLFTEHGYAGSVQEEVWRGPGDQASVGNHNPDRPERWVQGNKNIKGRYTLLTVRDDNRLSVPQLNADWNINVSCLEKAGGCDDARRILPELGRNPVPNNR